MSTEVLSIVNVWLVSSSFAIWKWMSPAFADAVFGEKAKPDAFTSTVLPAAAAAVVDVVVPSLAALSSSSPPQATRARPATATATRAAGIVRMCSPDVRDVRQRYDRARA